MPNSPIHTYTLTVPQSAIDDYGHVNNVIYVQWMQDAAIRHGEATPGYKLAEAKRSRAHRRYEFIRRRMANSSPKARRNGFMWT